MKTIAFSMKQEDKIKKSRFITYLFYIEEKEEIKKYLKQVKKEYPNATHYCYAYRLGQEEYYFDDKEPSKTAGFPILHVLKKQNLSFVLAIVVRYFGGILLGTGNLTRTYTNVVIKALQKVPKQELIFGKLIKIVFPYTLQKKIDHLPYDIETKIFEAQITYFIKIEENQLENIIAIFQSDPVQITIIKNIHIKK